jgi:hypothetical protein
MKLESILLRVVAIGLLGFSASRVRPLAFLQSSLLAGSSTPPSVQARAESLHDPLEREAFVDAMNEMAPTKRAAMLERFIMRFPESPASADAFFEAVAVYGKLSPTDRDEVSGLRPRASVQSSNLLQLALDVRWSRLHATLKSPMPPVAEAGCDRALDGIHSLPGWRLRTLTDDENTRVFKEAGAIFYGMAGLCAFGRKNYDAAHYCFSKGIGLDPDNPFLLYYFGLSGLEMDPIDVKGFWYCARAQNLNEEKSQSFHDPSPVPLMIYVRFHGSEQGWEEIMSNAASHQSPPVDFTVSSADKHLP